MSDGTLSTADLRPGDAIDVVVKLSSDAMVPAVVLWATGTRFLARSATALHRGGVWPRLGGRGLAYCESHQSDLEDEAEMLTWVRATFGQGTVA